MSKQVANTSGDPEIAAIGIVNEALKGLADTAAQQRVLEYVANRLGLNKGVRAPAEERGADNEDPEDVVPPVYVGADTHSEDLEGISPVAIKWMRRNGLSANGLSAIFSLGVDDIDLVAKKVPGKSKRDRMHSVFLLKGVAAYLSGGVARVGHDQIKEACIHYDAFDNTNFATYLKSFSSEISGAKASGYTLTTRGLTSATEMVKGLTTSTAK